jgi:hypothetical protein
LDTTRRTGQVGTASEAQGSVGTFEEEGHQGVALYDGEAIDMNSEDWRTTDLMVDDAFMERLANAVEKVRERLHRATGALEAAKIPYAVAEDCAVAAWVSRVDESAVRNTPEVNILVRRSDLESTATAFSKAGFVHRDVDGIHLFLDGPNLRARDSVRVKFAGEKIHADDIWPAPDVSESEAGAGFRVLALEALVTMKLVSFRTIDRLNLRDLIDVGLIDDTWLPRLPAELSSRLKILLDNPEG